MSLWNAKFAEKWAGLLPFFSRFKVHRLYFSVIIIITTLMRQTLSLKYLLEILRSTVI